MGLNFRQCTVALAALLLGIVSSTPALAQSSARSWRSTVSGAAKATVLGRPVGTGTGSPVGANTLSSGTALGRPVGTGTSSSTYGAGSYGWASSQSALGRPVGTGTGQPSLTPWRTPSGWGQSFPRTRYPLTGAGQSPWNSTQTNSASYWNTNVDQGDVINKKNSAPQLSDKPALYFESDRRSGTSSYTGKPAVMFESDYRQGNWRNGR